MKLYFCPTCGNVYAPEELKGTNMCHSCESTVEEALGKPYHVAMDEVLERFLDQAHEEYQDFVRMVDDEISRKLQEHKD